MLAVAGQELAGHITAVHRGARLSVRQVGAGVVPYAAASRWGQRLTAGFIEAARPCRHGPGNRWFAGRTSRKIAGRRADLYRAADRPGRGIDVLLPARRDLAAARYLFTRAMRIGTVPARGHGRPRARLGGGPRRAGRLGAGHRRAVRGQPGRGRSRTAEGPAPAGARAEAAPLSADPRRRSRLRAESAPWPLRHCRRRLPPPPAPRHSPSISRSSSDQRKYQMIMLWPCARWDNATVPRRVLNDRKDQAMARTVPIPAEQPLDESGALWGRLRREWHRVRRPAETGVPAAEFVGELVVEDPGADLQQQVGAAGCPAHLLLFDHALGDDLVDRGLGERGGDGLASTLAFPVVRDPAGVRAQVSIELAHRL